MTSNIYDRVHQEMKFFEICLDMAKRHIEDVLLTLSLIDDQQLPVTGLGAINREYLQDLNHQLEEIFVEMGSWEQVPQTAHLENDSAV